MQIEVVNGCSLPEDVVAEEISSKIKEVISNNRDKDLMIEVEVHVYGESTESSFY